MSLEDTLERLATSIDLLVDSNQHLAAMLRLHGPQAIVGKPLEQPAAAAPTADTKRGPGRPRKEAPASPLEQAAAKQPDLSAQPADSKVGSSGAPAGETAPASTSMTTSGTYADLQRLVPALAEAQGRSKAVALFAQLGVASGKELQEKAPDKIPAAVQLFRQALGEV